MSFDEILDLTAVEQAKKIADREISCVELTRGYLDRIDQHNPRLNAFVEVYHRQALWVARSKDAMVRRNAGTLPAFHGVPIGIKDLALVRGRRSRFGSRAVIPFWSPIDDASVKPLRKAGFNILGKLSTSELGAIPITEPDIHPPARNPWNRDHTPGGSSGGSAAAVAAKLLPVAHGSDGGGSIRIPASFNGLVGLKPRSWPFAQPVWIRGPAYSLYDRIPDTDGPRDGIAFGHHGWLDGGASPLGHSPERAVRETDSKKTRPAQNQIHARVADRPNGPRSASGDREGGPKKLSSLGHHVEEIAYPRASVEDFLPLWCLAISEMPGMRWWRAQPITKWLRDAGKKLDPKQILASQIELETRLLGWFEGMDVWLTPTSAVLPPRVGAISQNGDPRAAFFKVAELGAFTAPSNVSGQPAISVPAGLSKSGLPIGAHLVGPLQGEKHLLQLAQQLENENAVASSYSTRVIENRISALR